MCACMHLCVLKARGGGIDTCEVFLYSGWRFGGGRGGGGYLCGGLLVWGA